RLRRAAETVGIESSGGIAAGQRSVERSVVEPVPLVGEVLVLTVRIQCLDLPVSEQPGADARRDLPALRETPRVVRRYVVHEVVGDGVPVAREASGAHEEGVGLRNGNGRSGLGILAVELAA